VGSSGAKDPTPASFTWVVDLTPPSITVAASLSRLWPADGKMLTDTISGLVRDQLSGVAPGSVTFRVIDEYGEIQPAGPVSLQSDGTFSFVVMLEARRLGADQSGRDYRVVVTASDTVGNQTSAFTMVNVPHDQGN
jgi:hypothetical protein